MSERYSAMQSWLQTLFDTDAFRIEPVSEDASFRFYYRARIEDKSYVVMDAPPQHEDCRPFIDVTKRLQACDIALPIIHQQNLEQGFLLLDDLGDELYLDHLNSTTADELYSEAISTLLKFQTGADASGLKDYDEMLLRNEMALFNDWLLERHLNMELNDSQQGALDKVVDLLVASALEQPQVFVHRDYHSRNLMLTEENSPGVIDYQDAVCGPFSYDLVSLLKDCYIKWDQDLIEKWCEDYLFGLEEAQPDLSPDKDDFKRWFDLMGIQRHLKASGIFARLSHRDGKHGFLKDIPRTLSYIVDLEGVYPELDDLITLIKSNVLPGLMEQQD